MKKNILTAFSIISIVLGFTNPSNIMAKDIKSVVPTTSGPCTVDFFSDWENITYPLVYGVDANGVDRKGVTMYMKMIGASNVLGIGGYPSLVNVCLEPGWTVQAKDSTNGVQATLFYNGIKSIDFKYVLGKTDIRFY